MLQLKMPMEQRDEAFNSIDDMLDEKYGGEIEDFIQDKDPSALLANEIRQLKRLADKIIKTAKDTYRAIAQGWPVATSTNTRKARKQMKAQYQALAQRARECRRYLPTLNYIRRLCITKANGRP